MGQIRPFAPLISVCYNIIASFDVFLKGVVMDGPVVTGADMIRIIDEQGGMHWRIDDQVQFLNPPDDASQLQIGARLICISASLNKAPRHYTVASPLFCQRGTWAVVLESDASRNTYELPGLKQHHNDCRAVNVHHICRSLMGKIYKPPVGMRFLLSR